MLNYAIYSTPLIKKISIISEFSFNNNNSKFILSKEEEKF